jgi:hypothetical protein
MDYLRNHLRNLEIEVKNKEYNLSTLDNRRREIAYRAIPLEDKSIRLVSSNMGLTRRDDFNKINNRYKINDDSDLMLSDLMLSPIFWVPFHDFMLSRFDVYFC